MGEARDGFLGLKYPGAWKFDGCGYEMPERAVGEFVGVLLKIAGDNRQLLEDFKSKFGDSGWSSSTDWAISDLRTSADSLKSNAAEFIDALWKCVESAAEREVPTPSPATLNRILEAHGLPFQVAPPNLLLLQGDDVIVSEGSDGDRQDQPDRYIRGERLGSGGYGVVYKATRRTSVGEFECAIKVLDPSPFIADHAKALARFRREVAALRTLQHRAIVPYFDAGVLPSGKPYIVMPLIQGLDLRTICGTLPVLACLALFREVASAISFAHSKDVLHRDLKPSNIIVRSSDSQPIVLDFGAAYVFDGVDSKTLTSQAVGTIGYIPSEVLADPSIRSPLQDSYACGVMLYEALAGRRPDALDYEPLAAIRPDCEGIDDLVKRSISGASARCHVSELVGMLDRVLAQSK